MKKKILIISVIIILLILTIIVTNILFNINSANFNYSYNCCDSKGGKIIYQASCKCKSDQNIIEKTLIVLGIK